MVKQMSISD